MSDFIVRNCTDLGRNSIDIEIQNGEIRRIVPEGEGDYGAYDDDQRYEAGGKLVSPPLTEPHTHMNNALTTTSGDADDNPGGTLLEAIDASRDNRGKNINKEKIKQRAFRLVDWFVSYGVTRVRSHLELFPEADNPFAYAEAMLDVREEVSDIIDIQLVAMPTRGFANDDTLYDQFEEVLDMGVEVVGGLPQAEDTRERGIEHIEAALTLARRKDRLVDMHIDETDDPESRYTEVLAHKSKQHSIGHNVTASHVTSLHSQPDQYADKLCRLLAEAGVSVITNPSVNSVLQGRYHGYPKIRGHTRTDKLSEAGVTVGIGQDNIGDIFNPYGDGDPIQNLNFFAHFAHLNRLKDVDYLWQMVTSNNASIYGVDPEQYGLDEGNDGSLVVYDALTPFEAIRTMPSRNLVLRYGEPVARSTTTATIISDTEREVDFSTEFP